MGGKRRTEWHLHKGGEIRKGRDQSSERFGLIPGEFIDDGSVFIK